MQKASTASATAASRPAAPLLVIPERHVQCMDRTVTPVISVQMVLEAPSRVARPRPGVASTAQEEAISRAVMAQVFDIF